jgi:hypothetical protein
LLPTVLYNVRGAWRSVKQSRPSRELEVAKPTIIFFSSKLTEPRANQQGKRVRISRRLQVTNICSKYSIIDTLAP